MTGLQDGRDGRDCDSHTNNIGGPILSSSATAHRVSSLSVSKLGAIYRWCLSKRVESERESPAVLVRAPSFTHAPYPSCPSCKSCQNRGESLHPRHAEWHCRHPRGAARMRGPIGSDWMDSHFRENDGRVVSLITLPWSDATPDRHSSLVGPDASLVTHWSLVTRHCRTRRVTRQSSDPDAFTRLASLPAVVPSLQRTQPSSRYARARWRFDRPRA
jgi:hypothetical protein